MRLLHEALGGDDDESSDAATTCTRVAVLEGHTEAVYVSLKKKASVEEVAGVTPSDATPEKSFTDDLDVDSLSMVEIATAVEDKFGVAIPDDELGNIKTVGDAINYIEKNQG